MLFEAPVAFLFFNSIVLFSLLLTSFLFGKECFFVFLVEEAEEEKQRTEHILYVCKEGFRFTCMFASSSSSSSSCFAVVGVSKGLPLPPSVHVFV